MIFYKSATTVPGRRKCVAANWLKVYIKNKVLLLYASITFEASGAITKKYVTIEKTDLV